MCYLGMLLNIKLTKYRACGYIIANHLYTYEVLSSIASDMSPLYMETYTNTYIRGIKYNTAH